MKSYQVLLLFSFVFVCGVFTGFPWGTVYEGYRFGQENKAKLTVSMPMKQEDAEATLELLQNLVRQVREERKPK